MNVSDYPKPDDGNVEAFDLSEGSPEKFPIASFPLSLRTVASEMAAVYQTPVCLPAMSTLAVLSGAVGKSVVVHRAFKDRQTRLNLFVIAVAERGSGKGVIGETLCKPIAQESQELAKKHRVMVTSKRGELEVLKKEAARLTQDTANTAGHERANQLETLGNHHQRLEELEREANREFALLVGDTTSEKLGCALADNGETLFAYSAEAGAAVKVALGKYTDGGDFDLLLSAYSGDSVRTGRMGRKSVLLENPCLALLWLVQPVVIRQLVADAEAFARGLTARPLLFDTSAIREHDDRRNLDFTGGDSWHGFIAPILHERLSGNSPRVITCTAEAREVFCKFHDESVDLERDHFADVAGELSRWRENAIKVSGLFAIAEGANGISVDLAERAVAVVRWAGLNYLQLLMSGRRERLRDDLQRVLDLLKENGGAINLGELSRNHGIKRGALCSLMAAFPAHLEIKRIPQAGAGRPAEVLRAPTKST